MMPLDFDSMGRRGLILPRQWARELMTFSRNETKMIGPKTFRHLCLTLLLSSGLLLTSACGAGVIQEFDPLRLSKEANVDDLPENREILEVVGAYKTAMEERDLLTLKGLVSHEYYENSGTSDTSKDDYGHSGLQPALDRLADKVKSLRIEIVVKNLKVDGDRAFVVYEYAWNYMYEVGENPQWEAGRDINRMHLVKDSGGLWKISRGM